MPYNEWDDPTTPIPSLDEMRYELSAKNPINLVKKAIEHMPGSAFVQGVAPIVNFLPQVAGSTIYGLGKQIFSPETANFNADTTEAMKALQYEPPSKGGKDYQEAVANALEVAKVPPYIGHMPPMRFSSNDARVLAKQNIERAREIGNIREDFQNAQSGVQRESALGGNTYGGNLQRVADDLADVQARNQARRSEYAAPLGGSVQVFGDMMPDNAMYAVRPNKSGNQVVREVPTPLNPIYNATGESTLTEALQDIANNQQPLTEDNNSYQRSRHFTNMVPENFNKSAQDMFHEYLLPALSKEFPNIEPDKYSQALNLRYGHNNANEWYKKQLEAFSLTPEAEAHNQAAYKMAMSDPDIPDPFEFLKDVLIVPPSAKFEGTKAYDQWVMNNLQDYLTEHLGTPGDPALKLAAETGRTAVPEESMNQLLGNRRIEDEAKNLRRGNQMPEQGTFEPEIDRATNMLGQNNLTIQLLQDQENALIEANPNVRPQDIPGWKEARKEVVQATKRKDETAKKLENLRKAQALENYNDTMVRAKPEEQFTGNLEDFEKERFPMFPSGKDLAYQLRMPTQFRSLAKDVENRLAVSGAPGIKGLVKAADISQYSVPKAIQIRAEMMAQQEKMSEQVTKANEQKLMMHTKSRMEAMPQEGVFGPATVVRVDSTLSPMQIKADLSDITYWMDHCIGRGGSPDKKVLSPMALAYGPENVSSQAKYRQYQPTVLGHLNNKVPAGSSGASTTYMTAVERGENEIIDFRDTATGIPYATLNVKGNGQKPGKLRLGEFYGYQDHAVTGPMVPGRGREYTAEEVQPYRQAVADWANSKAEWLEPTGSDYLIDNADVYDLESPDHQSSLARELGVKNIEKREMVHSMGKRFITGTEAKEIWNAKKVEPQESIESLRAQREDIATQLREAEDPEATMGAEGMDDLRYQIEDLDQRIASMENRPPVGARDVAQLPAAVPERAGVDDVAPLVRNAVNALPNLRDNAFVTEIVAQQVIDLSGQVNFGQRPQDFIQQLRNRAQMLEETPGNGETNPDDNVEAARQMRMLASSLNAQAPAAQVPAAQVPAAQVPAIGDAYATVRRALQPLIEGEHIDTLVPIAEGIMQNRNGVYADLTDTQRIRLRQQIYDAMDRIRSNREPEPLTDIVAMEMNRIRDNYGQEVYNDVDGVLTAINDDYDIDTDPASFIERIRRQADMNRTRGDVQMQDIYTHAADLLTSTLRENIAIADARRRARNNVPALANPDAPISDTELQTVERSLRDPLSTAMANPPRIFDAYNAAIQDISRDDTPEEALRHLSVVRGILLDPETDLQTSFGLQEPADRQRLDALIRRHGDAIRQLAERDQGLPLDDDRIDDIASDYINNLDDASLDNVLQEAQDMRDGMVDLPEFRNLTPNQREEAQNAIAMRMDQYADMMDDMEEPPNQAPALPAPTQDLTVEQAAMREATQFPRYWYQRYPNLPQETVTGIMTRLHTEPDIEGLRVNARNRTRGTIFAGLNHNAREDAVRMIDEIGNRYQNELNVRDDQQLAQGQYNNATEAFNGLLEANNNFMLPTPEEGLNTLRALPQLLERENLRPHFGTTRLSQRQRQELEQHINELIRQRTENPQLPPPGHKRGGYIKKKKMKNGGEYNLPDLGGDEEEQKYTKPFNPPAIPYAYPGVSGARINRAVPIDRESAITMSADVSKRQDQSGTNYNVNEFGGGYHHKVGPGMLGISGSHRPGTHENRVNLMYAIPMNDGGRVEPSAPSSSVNDQSKPVMPIKKIQNPDAPEFKDILIRERAIRGGGTQSGGPSADLKQIMNPRNISYADGGNVSLDAMRYELLRKQ